MDGAMRRPTDLALLLSAQVSAVMTVMRQTPKWSLIPRRYSVRADAAPRPQLAPDHIARAPLSMPPTACRPQEDEDGGDEPLLEEFKALRRKVFTWEGMWHAMRCPRGPARDGKRGRAPSIECVCQPCIGPPMAAVACGP